MTPHDACAGEGCPGCCMTGEVDRWGLSRPRPLWYTTTVRIFYMDNHGRDTRTAEGRWLDMWHDVGVMWYYDSAWSREGDA